MFNPYVIAAALVAFIVTGTGSYVKGRFDCSARYQLEALEQERDALRTLINAERAARLADAEHLERNEAELRVLQEKADHDAENLSDRDSVCFGPADADSMRQHFRTTR